MKKILFLLIEQNQKFQGIGKILIKKSEVELQNAMKKFER
jgi:hypothetical protein